MTTDSSQQPASRASTNGVLPVTVAQTTGKTIPTKALSLKLKVLVRRLAPGLTEAEFTEALGEEWVVGGSKVDWLSFKPGKESKEYAFGLVLRCRKANLGN